MQLKKTAGEYSLNLEKNKLFQFLESFKNNELII